MRKISEVRTMLIRLTYTHPLPRDEGCSFRLDLTIATRNLLSIWNTVTRIGPTRAKLMCGEPNLAPLPVVRDGRPPLRSVCANRISMV
ncbi:MAG: hypothetical protein HN416_07020 [Nitrospina sp.]|nr:hypothetical protein [Nitrospina sp.]